SLLAIINDVLDFSKIDAGKLTLGRIPFGLRALIDATLKILSFRCEDKGLELASQVDDDVLDEWMGDPGRIRQVLTNIVGNAIKFTEVGRIEVRIRAERIADGDHVLRCSVADTGIGIEDSKLEAVFESFVQSDSSITREFGGTGLGLSISSRLVRLMGGSMWVESELGVGSTFWFELRLTPNSDQRPTDRRSEDRPTFDGPSLRVLVSEDNEVNQKLVRLMLSKAGHEVTVVDNGEACLEALDQGSFDVVLMDMMMPIMDGLAATAMIRKHEQDAGGNAHLPIIALTANAMSHDRERCLDAGMDDFVAKPIRREELLAKLRSVVEGLDQEPNSSASC
ncbi:MAG: response regulator, partial [Planctomycetes bacterium]|nr:response regulator [Planctomycetota bacterium]